jgi:hypothetical protein
MHIQQQQDDGDTPGTLVRDLAWERRNVEACFNDTLTAEVVCRRLWREGSATSPCLLASLCSLNDLCVRPHVSSGFVPCLHC